MKFPFLKQSSDPKKVECGLCNSEFSINQKGVGSIHEHVQTKTHRQSEISASTNKKVSDFFQSTSKVDLVIAAKEAVFAYHTIRENHSFRSATCSAQLIRSVFNHPKFHCAETKCGAIVAGVFFPMVIETIKNELEKVIFVSIATDASN